jgi:putative inorganic carbon (HCO3(-)) transporter
MAEVDPQAPTATKETKFRELFKRWDWLLLVAIAPAMIFPDARQAWALLAIPLVLAAQGIAWGEVLPVTPLNPAILLLAFMVGVSTFVTPDLAGSLGKIAGLLFGMAVYFCAARHTRSKGGWKGSLVLFVMAGTGIALIGLTATNWATGKSLGLDILTAQLPLRFSGLPGAESGIHPNELAGALLWVIPVVIMAGLALMSEPGWFADKSGKLFSRLGKYSGWIVLLIAAFVIELGVLVLTQARGSYLAIALTGLALMILIPRWPKRWWAIAVLIVIVVSGVMLAQQLGIGTIQSLTAVSTPTDTSVFSLDSINMRVEIWSHAIWAIRDVPLTGLGMNVFRSALYTLYPTFTVSASYDIGHAHNELLQAALDLGLPGLTGFLALYIGAVGMLFLPMKIGGAARLLALGMLGGLLAHFLFGITDAVALGAKPGFLMWWLMGMVFGLYDLSQASQAG